LPAKVTVITAAEIQRLGATTVQEAIQYATGIVMFDQVGSAFQHTVDLRGFNGQPVGGTSVFVDGVRVNEPDFNTVNFDLIPLETIGRIEILPGPSAVYGKNALGGVINIITKRDPEKRQATADTLFGSFHRERYTIQASGPIGKFDYYGTFSREIEDGFRDESDARISRFFGKLGFRPTEQTDLTVSYTYANSRLLQAGSLPLSVAAFDRKRNFTPGDFFDSETNFVRVTGRQTLPLGLSLNANAYYRRLGQELFTVNQPFFPGGSLPITKSQLVTESRGGTAQLTHDATLMGHRNQLVLGTELTRNDFGNRFRSQAPPFPDFVTVSSTDEDIWGLYLQDTFNLTAQLLLTAGVRFDHDQLKFVDNLDSSNNGNKRFSRTTPRGGLTYLFTPQTSVYFNYSQGFRVPTFLELFSLGPFGSNPNLRPVRSHNYELGYKSQLGTWGEGALALFQADVRDEIFFTCLLCDFSPQDGQNRNIEKSRRRGFEGTLKAKYNNYLDGQANYTFTEAQSLTTFKLSATRVIDPGDSFTLVPKHRLSITGNFHPQPEWTLSLIGLYVSTQFHVNDEENVQPRLPGYFVLNGRVSYERPVPGGRLTGFVMVNNLLDQKYSAAGFIATNNLTGGGAVERFVVPAPGIAVYGGLSYRFETF